MSPAAAQRRFASTTPTSVLFDRSGDYLSRTGSRPPSWRPRRSRSPRLVDVVGDEEDRLADLGLEAQELVLEPLTGDRVDRAEGLVHQHHRRVRGEGSGDADALLLTARELGRIAVGDLRIERDQLHQLLDAGATTLLGPAQQARDRGDVLADRPVREEADLLDHVADLAPQLRRVAIRTEAPRRDVAGRSDRGSAAERGPTRTQISPAATSSERSLTAGALAPR